MATPGQDYTLAFLRSWLELAQQETEAIQRENWSDLRHCQDRIQALQAQWERTEAAAAQQSGGVPANEEIRSLVRALIERERHNQRLLAERQAKLREEMEHWNGVAVRIRRFSRGMNSSAPSVWSRFS